MSLDSFSTARTSTSTSTDADADNSPISPLEPRTWTLSPSILEDTQIARARLTPPPSSAHSGAPSPTIPTHPPRIRQSQLLRESSTRSLSSPYDRASKPAKYENAHPSRGQQRHHLFPPSSQPRTSPENRGPSPAPSFSVVSCSPAPVSPSATSAQNLRSDENPSPLHATLRWEISPSNPRNWPARTKWLRAFLPCCAFAFTIAFGASIVAPGMETFSNDRMRGVLPLSLYVLGLVFGPPVGGIGSAVFGRKLVLLLSTALFGIFTLAAGLLHRSSGVLAFRFLAGLAASPVLPASLSALADLWPNGGEKSVSLAVFLAFTALCSTLGPVVGGVVVQEEGWRWTQFVVLFAFAGCVVPILAMKETERKAIRRREKRGSMRGKVSVEEVREIIVEPMRMLGREKRVLLSSLVGGYYVGVEYAVYTVLPGALGDGRKGFGVDSQGYVFGGMSVGVLAGLMIFLGYERFVWRPRGMRYQEAHTTSTTATIPAIWDEKTPEEEKQRRRSSKRLSFGPSHEQILMNTSGTPDRRGKRDSLLLSLRRMSFGNSYRNLDSEHQSPQDAHRNLLLAVVASRYLNALGANSERKIAPERMLLLWNQHQDFGNLCLALEGHGLKLQRVDFARSLIDGLEGEDDDANRQHPPSRRDAMAVAELEKKFLPPNSTAADAAAPFPVIRTAPPLSPSKATKRSNRSPPPHLPPPEWRLALALPSAIFLPASLFILAWTTRAEIHWIVPVIGLFLFALSGVLTCISLTLYVMDACGPAQSPAALAAGVVVSCLAGFAFPLFAQPMVKNLGIGWGLSVFAFVGVFVGVLPAVLLVWGKKRKEKKLGGSRGWNIG